MIGFVAQIGLMPESPLPLTDLSDGNSFGYSKRGEAVEDRGANLDLRNLPIKTSRKEALGASDGRAVDRDYDADRYREVSIAKRMTPGISGRKPRKTTVRYDTRRMKNWRYVATQCDGCPKVFLSAAARAAPVMLWL